MTMFTIFVNPNCAHVQKEVKRNKVCDGHVWTVSLINPEHAAEPCIFRLQPPLWQRQQSEREECSPGDPGILRQVGCNSWRRRNSAPAGRVVPPSLGAVQPGANHAGLLQDHRVNVSFQRNRHGDSGRQPVSRVQDICVQVRTGFILFITLPEK